MIHLYSFYWLHNILVAFTIQWVLYNRAFTIEQLLFSCVECVYMRSP